MRVHSSYWWKPTPNNAYEGSGSGDWRTDAFIVGIGYRF
ncbi:hypothetical protein BIU77_17405 [Escherichia coli]|nr:hypothetical protein BIU77_17405 [Escherichia coli]